MTEAPILRVRDLSISLSTGNQMLPAVVDVSFEIFRGEVFGLVGESGCGKSLCALTIAGLLQPPMRVTGGEILFAGTDLSRLTPSEMMKFRGSRISMIFQEPMTALNPLMTVGDQIGEMFVLHRGMSEREARRHAVQSLDMVQVPSASRRIHDYPHQLSGGMRQRIVIAIALACDPELLIADEPTTALDVTIQAEIVELILDLCKAKGTAVLMISHDLGLVARISNRVAAMYAGQIVEARQAADIFTRPAHPYTSGLVASLPRLGRRLLEGQARLTEIPGVVPSLFDPRQGCRFHARCSVAMDRCRTDEPPFAALASGGHARCLLHG